MFFVPFARRSSFALLPAAAVAGVGGMAHAQFYTGADVSLLTFMQQNGVSFKDNGVAANADQILYNAGANLFRLRIFVNPGTTYNTSASGAMQTTAYDIALSQQIKADDPTAKILLDFHYSDTWADPIHQAKPAAWAGDSTQAQLNSDVQTYTQNTLQSFKNAGVLPDMVQVGNETTNGMLWQSGTIGQNGSAGVGGELLYSGSQQTLSWQNFGGLLNSAIAGVRAVQGAGPRIPVALSIDSGDKNGLPQYFFGNITSPSMGNVTDFDIEGVDYYPSNSSGKSFAFLQSNLTTLANTNYAANPGNPKKIMLLETNYPYTTHSGLGISQWPSTPAGQEQEFIDVRNVIMNLPHNDGEGILYWYPESVQAGGFNIYNGGATALFSSTGNAEPALSSTTGAFNVTGNITATWVTNQSDDWNTTGNWLGGVVPNAVNAEADLLAQISAPRTLTNNSAVTLGSLYFNNANSYTLGGSGSLTMSMSSGSALVDCLGGSHTINLPITIASNTSINIASGGGLQLTAPLTVNAGQSLTLSLQSNASLSFNSSFHAASLSLASGSRASIAAHGANPPTLLQLDSLAFGGSTNAWLGKLDVSNNAMIVHGGVLADIANQLKSGFNSSSGYWNGATGIVSTAAAADTQLLTTIGYGPGGNPLNGVSTTSTDVLVKYTYYGDANLDGAVDGADYQQIDNGFGLGLTGWSNGDFNYDGVIDGSDFSLIDNTYNQLNAINGADPLALLAHSTAVNASSLVPEPSILGLLGIGAIGGLRRRIRRSAGCTSGAPT